MAILPGIQGILELIIAAFAIGGLVAIGHTLVVHGHARTGTAIDILGWILGAVPLIVGVITLILALGLWFLKRWAFWTTVVISAIILFRQIVECIKPHDSVALIIAGMILPAVILLYLFLIPDVRRAFHL